MFVCLRSKFARPENKGEENNSCRHALTMLQVKKVERNLTLLQPTGGTGKVHISRNRQSMMMACRADTSEVTSEKSAKATTTCGSA